MSTYSTIQGSVVLDAKAAEAFTASPSWQWCTAGGTPENAITVTESDGNTIIAFNAGSYRNLCRHLYVDLVDAQRRGNVDGVLTDDCVDGANGRTVVRYSRRTVLVGETDCLYQTVIARPGVVIELGSGDVSLRALVPCPPRETSIEVELSGAPAVDSCECGGWDEERDEPICASGTR